MGSGTHRPGDAIHLVLVETRVTVPQPELDSALSVSPCSLLAGTRESAPRREVPARRGITKVISQTKMKRVTVHKTYLILVDASTKTNSLQTGENAPIWPQLPNLGVRLSWPRRRLEAKYCVRSSQFPAFSRSPPRAGPAAAWPRGRVPRWRRSPTPT